MSNKRQKRKQYDAEMNEWKARHDLDALLEFLRIEKDPERLTRVRVLARQEILNLSLATGLDLEAVLQ